MIKGFKGRIIALAGGLFILVSMWFLGKSFVDGVHEAGGIGNLLHFNVPLFLVASVIMAVHLALAGYTWTLATGAAGGCLGFKGGFSIHFLSQVGKYVPGKVWAAMGKFTLSRNSGLSTAQTGQGLVLETVFIVLGCLITTLPLIPLAAKDAGLGAGTGMAVAVGLAMLLLVSIHPAIFRRITGLAAKVMKSRYTLRECSFPEMLRILSVYIIMFFTLGVAYWLMCLSFGLSIPFFPGAFIYPAAMGIGYLAIFAPGGLGARELTTVLLVRLIVPDCEPGLAELTAIVARLWITLGEAIAFGISFPLYGVTPSSLKKMLSGIGSSDGYPVQGDKGQ
ncbi:MAG: flippase-like domain-containing protein [Candidatus Sabulitectum sp.]|nr:flippase-like domain-containing protein [Candidatus Sabulitectum sp.]